MTQVDFGPVNIRQGNSAEFIAQFFDVNGNLITPLSANFSITYQNLNYASQTDNITMLPFNADLTCVWSSTNALPGLAPWTVAATSASSIAQNGIVRVYDP